MTEVTKTETKQTTTTSSPEALQEEPTKKRSRILLVLAAMGPGVIAAMAGNDAGGISTYSTAGAKSVSYTHLTLPTT